VETINFPQGLSWIDIEAGLKRLSGNRKLYRKLLLDFAGSYSAAYDDIGRALKQDDTILALRLVHTLKGVAGNISALEIQLIAGDLEKALTRSSAREAESLMVDLGKTVKSVNDTMSGLLEPAPAAPAQSEKAYDAKKAETLLLDLARLIWEDNVNAEQSLEEFRNVIGSSAYGEDIKALTVSIGDYDFDTAKEVLQRIAGKMNIDLGGY
jgi:two-component system sensor histidine kinase/response regulator